MKFITFNNFELQKECINIILLLIKFQFLFYCLLSFFKKAGLFFSGSRSSFKLDLSKNKAIKYNNSLEKYFSQIFCRLLYFKRNYNCYNKIFNNVNFFDDINEIEENIHLFLNLKITKIEYIFLLIGTFPFLKSNSTLSIKINHKDINQLFQIIFQNKNIKKNFIIKNNHFDVFKEKLNEIINYQWEIIPNQNITNFIRYIINNYYNETYLNLFDALLSSKFKNYIEKKNGHLSNKQIKDILCKFNNFLFYILKSKYWGL